LITLTITTDTSLKNIVGTGENEFSVPPGSTLKELFSILVRQFWERLATRLFLKGSTNIFPSIRFMINGQDIAFLNGMERVLKDEEEVLLLLPVSGG
jgi:molybdopterin converting factor small subunit